MKILKTYIVLVSGENVLKLFKQNSEDVEILNMPTSNENKPIYDDIKVNCNLYVQKQVEYNGYISICLLEFNIKAEADILITNMTEEDVTFYRAAKVVRSSMCCKK